MHALIVYIITNIALMHALIVYIITKHRLSKYIGSTYTTGMYEVLISLQMRLLVACGLMTIMPLLCMSEMIFVVCTDMHGHFLRHKSYENDCFSYNKSDRVGRRGTEVCNNNQTWPKFHSIHVGFVHNLTVIYRNPI